MSERYLHLAENPPIVKIEHLHKEFEEVTAIEDLSLEIPEGKIIGLLGPNGSGKTTLMKIMAGLYNNYSGTVEIEGRRPGKESKAKVSYLPDRPVFSMKNATKDVLWLYEDFFADFNREKFDSLMEEFGIEEDKPFKEMSKGMIDKVQLSLAMSRDARLFLLDEPLGGVDVLAREKVIDVILENFDYKGTILVATHQISEIEKLFDSAIVINGGKLVAYRDCDELRRMYGTDLNGAAKELFRGGAV